MTIERLHDVLFSTAARAPERVALVAHDPDGGRWTYGEVAAAATAMAAQLVELGVAPGDRVALMAHNGLAWVAGFFGALAAGAVAVPINTAADPHSLVHYVTDCGAAALVIGARVERVVAQAGPGLGALTIVAPAAIAPGDEAVEHQHQHQPDGERRAAVGEAEHQRHAQLERGAHVAHRGGQRRRPQIVGVAPVHAGAQPAPARDRRVRHHHPDHRREVVVQLGHAGTIAR